MVGVSHRPDCMANAIHSCSVDHANWNGEHASSTSLPNCRANVFATNRRKTVPVAISRTPQSLLFNAVIDANMNERKKVPSTAARAKSCAGAVTKNKISRSPKQTRKISFVQPPGPEELPESALRRHEEQLGILLQLLLWHEVDDLFWDWGLLFLRSSSTEFLQRDLITWWAAPSFMFLLLG